MRKLRCSSDFTACEYRFQLVSIQHYSPADFLSFPSLSYHCVGCRKRVRVRTLICLQENYAVIRQLSVGYEPHVHTLPNIHGKMVYYLLSTLPIAGTSFHGGRHDYAGIAGGASPVLATGVNWAGRQ